MLKEQNTLDKSGNTKRPLNAWFNFFYSKNKVVNLLYLKN